MRRSRALCWVAAAALLVGLQSAAPALGALEFDDADYEDEESTSVNSNAKKAGKGGTKAAPTGTGLKAATPQQEAPPSPVTIPLEHSLGGGEFTPAGLFTAMAHTHPQTQAVRITQVKLQRDRTSAASEKTLAMLLATDAPYRIRVAANVFGTSPGKWVMSSLPLRCLVNADLAENFVLQMDDRGNILAVDYTTHSGECITEETSAPDSWDFKPVVYTRLPKDAPRLNPDYYMNYHAPTSGRGSQADPSASQTQSYTGPPGGEKKKEDEGPLTPEKFLRKYWMYIVPLGLITLNNMIAPPDDPKTRRRAA